MAAGRRLAGALGALVCLMAMTACGGGRSAMDGSSTAPNVAGRSGGPGSAGRSPGSAGQSPTAPGPGGGGAGGLPPAPGGTGPRPPAGTAATLVEFGRQGGIAGLDDRLTVMADGSFTLVRGKPVANRRGQLGSDELAGLRNALSRSNFAGLPGVQSAQGNDLFTYRVVYGGRQILAQDGGVVPPLTPVITALSGIVARHG